VINTIRLCIRVLYHTRISYRHCRVC